MRSPQRKDSYQTETGLPVIKQDPYEYRARNKGMQILLSNSQAGPGRTVKQEQEEISRNHVQTFISPLYVYVVSNYLTWSKLVP